MGDYGYGDCDFGGFLRQARLGRNLSVRQLALYSRVSGTYVSQLERGLRRAPSPLVLRKLAAGLRLPYDELLAAAGYLPEAAGTGGESPARTEARELTGLLYELMEDLPAPERASLREEILSYLRVRFGDRRRPAPPAHGPAASTAPDTPAADLSVRSDRLHNGGDAHSPSNAQRNQPVAGAAPPKRVEEGH